MGIEKIGCPLEQARSLSWETITATCGLSQAEIAAAATIIGTSKAVVFGWAMGITQHTNGNVSTNHL
ncbi:hypothetical protein [Calothrix sp. FACHB-168]|uniref:hypothetical protein n=1 Tax=Calothrix sp. FACHB-168 TaxID=2692780 RepID=UPI0030DC1121